MKTSISHFKSLMVAVGLSVFGALPAHAAVVGNQTLYFSANCIDCAQQAAQPKFGVNGILTLSGEYQVGDQITHQDFISFEYLGSNLFGAFTVYDTPGLGLGGLIENLTGPNWFAFIREDGLFFETRNDGTWILCPNGLQGEELLCNNANSADFGDGASISAIAPGNKVPEPGTLALLASGLALTFIARKRRLASSAAA
jgi:PEP-CTERM motif